MDGHTVVHRYVVVPLCSIMQKGELICLCAFSCVCVCVLCVCVSGAVQRRYGVERVSES